MLTEWSRLGKAFLFKKDDEQGKEADSDEGQLGEGWDNLDGGFIDSC